MELKMIASGVSGASRKSLSLGIFPISSNYLINNYSPTIRGISNEKQKRIDGVLNKFKINLA